MTRITPLDGADGAGGYRIEARDALRPWRRGTRSWTAGAVVVSGGVLGTLGLLWRARERGDLPRLSRRLGDVVRTNSESFTAITSREPAADHSQGLAIMASARIDANSTVEVVRYPRGSDFIATLATTETEGGGALPRPLRWAVNNLRRPGAFLRSLWPFGWAKKSVLLMIMQTLDSHLKLGWGRVWWWPFSKGLKSEIPPGQDPPPSYIPSIYDVSRRLAARWRGEIRSPTPEVLLGLSTTAHILGGCGISKDAESGVVDAGCRVHGYQNLYVVDGSVIPVNLGVNPSLTITALAEHAMSQVPPKG